MNANTDAHADANEHIDSSITPPQEIIIERYLEELLTMPAKKVQHV